jgi:hypothetical protein
VELLPEPQGYQWALPQGLDVPPDELRCRLDFYQDTTVLYFVDRGVITTRAVSARDVALAFLREMPLSSGILPAGALWCRQSRDGAEVALWRSPRVWQVALVTEPLKSPRRFRLPMPGLIFICSPGKAPRVYAAKRRPKKPEDIIYHAPLFNLFQDGRTCPGTHKFPVDIGEMPESFFQSFFSMEASYKGRSKKYPDNLLKLWEELDGKKRYPLGDLVSIGKVEEIMR